MFLEGSKLGYMLFVVFVTYQLNNKEVESCACFRVNQTNYLIAGIYPVFYLQIFQSQY